MLPFANPRHQHEWRRFAEIPLADDQIIVAGVIDDLTGFVEHPEVVADRLENVARAVGDPHRVMAGTDCGFDTSAGMGRVTEDVVWAKFRRWPTGRRSQACGWGSARSSATRSRTIVIQSEVKKESEKVAFWKIDATTPEQAGAFPTSL